VNLRTKGIAPVVLGVAMLAIVIAAAFTPNFGTVSAQSSTPYNQPASSPSGLSTYAWLGIAAVIIIAALLLALFLMSRRRGRPTPPAGARGAEPWEGGAPSTGPGSSPAGGPPGPSPAYLETPEDVGSAPPPVSAPAAGAAAGAGAGAPKEEEADIDSLMAELDKISGEILKRAPKKGSEPPTDEADGAPPPS
jgi:hypothetical protein